MHIENITINLGGSFPPSPLGLAAFASLVGATVTEGEEPETGVPAATLTPPRIGEYWLAQGGIYMGVAAAEDGLTEGYLILATEDPITKRKWDDAVAWARTVTVNGHTDFRLPTRFESALIYANARGDGVVDRDHWHWTGTQYSASYAYYQYFNYGYQDKHAKSFEARARAVRRLTA